MAVLKPLGLLWFTFVGYLVYTWAVLKISSKTNKSTIFLEKMNQQIHSIPYHISPLKLIYDLYELIWHLIAALVNIPIYVAHRNRLIAYLRILNSHLDSDDVLLGKGKYYHSKIFFFSSFLGQYMLIFRVTLCKFLPWRLFMSSLLTLSTKKRKVSTGTQTPFGPSSGISKMILLQNTMILPLVMIILSLEILTCFSERPNLW